MWTFQRSVCSNLSSEHFPLLQPFGAPTIRKLKVGKRTSFVVDAACFDLSVCIQRFDTGVETFQGLCQTLQLTEKDGRSQLAAVMEERQQSTPRDGLHAPFPRSRRSAAGAPSSVPVGFEKSLPGRVGLGSCRHVPGSTHVFAERSEGKGSRRFCEIGGCSQPRIGSRRRIREHHKASEAMTVKRDGVGRMLIPRLFPSNEPNRIPVWSAFDLLRQQCQSGVLQKQHYE